MRHVFDVIIVGGGVVGLSAALAMNQRGYSVALIDANEQKTENPLYDARVYAINQASQSLLDALGVWPQLDKTRVSPYQHMHVWDASNGACIDFDARMVGTDYLGSILQESVLRQALLAAMNATSIEIFSDCRISELQRQPNALRISDGNDAWQTSLLIVADGASSKVRELLGVRVNQWPYHQHSIVTTIKTEKSHDATAYQVFNPEGPLAFLPLVDRHQCSIVWSTKPAQAQRLMALSDLEFAEAIKVAFAAKLGHCEILSLRYQFPLHMRHTQKYSGPHWLLMGDAAHTIHPLAGLGLNLGLSDLSTWLNINSHQGTPQKWSNKTLAAYQRQRKSEVWKTIALMEGIKTLFAEPLPPVPVLRGLGLRLCNHLSPLKRYFIRHASGL